MDKELISHYKSDNGKSLNLYHAYFEFEVTVPKSFDTKREDYKFKPAFERILDVRNKLYLHQDKKTYVWAVMNPIEEHKYFFLIQVTLG